MGELQSRVGDPGGPWGWGQALSMKQGQAWLELPEVSFPAH